MEMAPMDPTIKSEYICDDYCPIEEAKIQLVNKELWDQFHQSGTEMIITKSGRRMFPHLSIKLSGLDPSEHYCLFIEFDLAQRCRLRYSCSGGWAAAGHEDTQSPHRIYMHPESPSKGKQWMNQEITFSRIKLTNTPAPPPGQIVLSSMHKYQPKIILVKTNNPQALGWAPTKVFVFPETQFIAVTAYQNENITKLKINYNPFAKGFRENGKSSIKRKQINGERADSPNSKKSATPSPPPQIEVEQKEARKGGAPLIPYYSNYYYSPYPFYNQWWAGPVPMYYQYPMRYPDYDICVAPEAKKPKKLTDFSINAIINS